MPPKVKKNNSEEEESTFTLSQIKEILSIQEATMMNFIKMNITSMNERIDNIMKEFTKEITEIKGSVSFTEDVLEKKVSSCEEKLWHLGQFKFPSVDEWNETKDKINDLENRSRRNNIRIDGIPEDPKETWEQTEEKLKKVLHEKLNIDEDIKIERAHRTGDKVYAKNKNRHRTIVAKIHNFKDKQIIFNNARIHKLANHKIYISDDFSLSTRRYRRDLHNAQKVIRGNGEYAAIRGVGYLDTIPREGWVNKNKSNDQAEQRKENDE